MEKSSKPCISDVQCNNNYMCTFNNQNLKHYCKTSNPNKLYLGCLDKDYNDFEYTVSNAKDTNSNFQDCLQFSRKQTTKEGMHHNYMMFKRKRLTPIDLPTVSIYLLCGPLNIATFPIEDYFEQSCDEDQENCTFTAKKIFFNFIRTNKLNCNQELFLQIKYECVNEPRINKEVIPLKEVREPFSFTLHCPTNKNNPRLKSKCVSFYIDDTDKEKYTKINQKKLLYGCTNPIYKVPMLVKDVSLYKKNNFKKMNNAINEVDQTISDKKKELLDLEAHKYQQIYKLNHNESIPKEKAIEKVKDRISNDDIEKKWKCFENIDALQNIIHDAQYKASVSYYGKVYTIEEAMKAANDNNQCFFVYYSNSFELQDYTSHLYFIDIYGIDTQVFDKQNWTKSKGVTTALLNFENYYDQSTPETGVFNDYISNLLVYQQLMSDELKHLNNKNVNEIHNINDIVITNLNNTLDKKITTKNQQIRINDQKEIANNYLINMLSFLFFAMIVIFVFIILYYNAKKT